MRIITWCGVAAAFALGGCTDGGEPVPAVYFEMFAGEVYDTTPFDTAWSAARADPAAGVDYTFPLITEDLAPGTEVRLLVGRSTNGTGYPATTADDVILADELQLETSTVDAAGRVVFAPLAVTTGPWTSDSGTIPAAYLAGTTVIAARAFARGDDELPAYRYLAGAFFVAVTGDGVNSVKRPLRADE